MSEYRMENVFLVDITVVGCDWANLDCYTISNDNDSNIRSSCFSSGAADTALAKPSGAGGGASAHSPQPADYVGNVSVRRSASSAVKELLCC